MIEPSQSSAIARYLRAVVGQPSDGPTDAELLSRFALSRDQGAFELLVWRHAGMVTAVCRNVLKDHHAAEDATQAAFLTLAKKAGTVRENPAGWLYRVARRIALRMASRRRDVPTQTTAMTRIECEDVAVLHDELAKLPDKYRLPVLLCFFEGLSHADAAKRLGWPTGTVAGRIARAKETLHSRLTRRVVTVPSTGITALCLTEGIDGAFAETTTRAATAFAMGVTVTGVSTTTITLAKGAMTAMTISKLQTAAGVLFACATLTAGTVWAVGQGQGPGAAGSGSGGIGGEAAPSAKPTARQAAPKPLTRLKIDPNAPAPGKPAEPKRNADYAQRQNSKENLKKIVLAIHNHHDATVHFPHDIVDENGKALLSWRVQLLPYLEEAPLYNKFKLNEPWDSEHNKKLLAEMPGVFRIGFEPKGATDTYYQAFSGLSTGLIEVGKKLKFADIADGTSNTLGVAEVGPAVPWSKPVDVQYHPGKAFPKVEWPFANVIQFAMMDGSYRGIKPDTGELIWRWLIERDDGQNIPEPGLLQPKFVAEAAEEKVMLARTLDANAALLEETEQLWKELIALHKYRNLKTNDVDSARQLTEEFKLMILQLKPRIKKYRDEIGLSPGSKVPEPKELPKP